MRKRILILFLFLAAFVPSSNLQADCFTDCDQTCDSLWQDDGAGWLDCLRDCYRDCVEGNGGGGGGPYHY